MNNQMMIDVDPLSSYETQYDYPHPNPHYYPHPPHPIPYPYKSNETQIFPPYQPILPELKNAVTENVAQDYSTDSIALATETNEEEEDIKPVIDDIEPTPQDKPKRTRKVKGKTSSYWNKKISDKNFAFYGCSVCNIAYTDLTDLDQHVVIHSNRMTSYDLRIQNLKKRKRLKKEKKKQKKDSKVKLELDIDIKPEDGYIGTEKASEFGDKKSELKKSCGVSPENNENNPVNKFLDKNTINVYKCFGCNKQFALSYYLRIHVRSHTDEKPYTCSVCKQTFITASKLGRHTKRIHLAVRHQCRICFKYFSRFELLVKHFDKKHAEDKLDGEPYDYNTILPYLKELEEQLKQEKEQKPKTEDPWDLPLGLDAVGTVATATATATEAELVAKEEIFVTKEEDEVILPSNVEFFDESKEESELQPTAKVTVEEVKVDFDIKIEMEDENQPQEDQGGDDGGAVDDDDEDDDDAADVKCEKDQGSDEEYFPSDTWARSPPSLPAPPSPPNTRKSKSTSCQICKKKLSSKSYLRIHMRTHTGERPFSCYICHRGFITASKMHRHVLTHDESWEGKDGIKPEDEDTEVKSEPESDEKPAKKKTKKSKANKAKAKIQKTKKTFFEKKQKKFKKWDHVCEFCHQKFLHLETLEVHKKSHEKADSMKCHYCFEPQLDAESLKEHEATHTGPKPYVCTLCGNCYMKRGSMVYHRKTRCKLSENSDKTFICDICKKRYNTHGKLQRHMVTHSVAKFTLRYECPVCAHMFHTRYHVQMHLKSHMKEGLILEENRNAVLAMVLQNARKIPKTTDAAAPALPDAAPDERSRICNICGQIFQHFYYLEEHLKTHGSKIAVQDFDKEEEKKFTCQVCFKSFKLQYYLKLHSYTHTKEKPIICQQCGKGFITKGKLKRHLETHQGLKKYQCHICYKFFTRPGYLRIHVRTIHGTQDYNFRDYGIGVPLGAISNDS